MQCFSFVNDGPRVAGAVNNGRQTCYYVEMWGLSCAGQVLTKRPTEGLKHTTQQEAPTQATCAMAAW